jgi:Rap1a immunity proteins
VLARATGRNERCAMKVRGRLIVGSLLLLGVLLPAAAQTADGHNLLQACTLALRAPTVSQELSKADFMKAGYCVGLLDGLGGMNQVWQEYTQDTSRFFCSPPGSRRDQIVRVVVRYLENHPEQLHEHEIILAGWALSKAFPCLPKAQTPRR